MVHSAADVSYDAATSSFVLESAASFGDGFAVSPAATALGLNAGAQEVEPIAVVETPDVALSRIEGIDCNFFGISVHSTISEDFALADAVRDWAAARPRRYFPFFDLVGSDVLVSAETTSIGAQLSRHSLATASARFLQRPVHHRPQGPELPRPVQLHQLRPAERGHQRQVPPAPRHDADRTDGDPAPRSWTARGSTGTSAVGRGTDADTKEGKTLRHLGRRLHVWLAWFKDALEVTGYNFLKSSAGIGGVPITDQGLAAMADALEAVCERGVRNGGIAPNFVSPEMRAAIQRATGNADFDGFLSAGYLVVRPRAADVSQALRNTRGPIPVSIFVKGSGQVNFLDIDVTFEN